ncbi:unnamed protein product, partial [Rangifer tarandus platyrhynchus]
IFARQRVKAACASIIPSLERLLVGRCARHRVYWWSPKCLPRADGHLERIASNRTAGRSRPRGRVQRKLHAHRRNTHHTENRRMHPACKYAYGVGRFGALVRRTTSSASADRRLTQKAYAVHLPMLQSTLIAPKVLEGNGSFIRRLIERLPGLTTERHGDAREAQRDAHSLEWACYRASVPPDRPTHGLDVPANTAEPLMRPSVSSSCSRQSAIQPRLQKLLALDRIGAKTSETHKIVSYASAKAQRRGAAPGETHVTRGLAPSTSVRLVAGCRRCSGLQETRILRGAFGYALLFLAWCARFSEACALWCAAFYPRVVPIARKSVSETRERTTHPDNVNHWTPCRVPSRYLPRAVSSSHLRAAVLETRNVQIVSRQSALHGPRDALL